jgi:hypothetical protein
MTNTLKSKRHYKRASHVRFNQKQFARIERDSVEHDKSIPSLLREKYFKSPRPTPLIAQEDIERILGELRAIGNRMNETARRVNDAVWGNVSDDMRAVQPLFDQLWNFLTTKYCRCKPLPRPAT